MKKTTNYVTATAHCSTANLGAGFDVFGLALAKYVDRVHVRPKLSKGVTIRALGPYSKELPKAINKNSAGPPAKALIEKSGQRIGVEILIEKNVPPGLGLGSSGATAAACTKAMDSLLKLHLPDSQLVQIAGLGEAAVSGSAHFDNVGASLLGGLTIVYGKPLSVVSVNPPAYLSVVVVSPKDRSPKNKTGVARKLVPNKIGTRNAILNVGRAAAIALGFAKGDIELIGSGMEDAIAEPRREILIPGYKAARTAALSMHASGVAISGAGPSVVAMVDRKKQNPEKIGRIMVREFSKYNLGSNFFVTRPAEGARISGS
jgi:homoserine kinase